MRSLARAAMDLQGHEVALQHGQLAKDSGARLLPAVRRRLAAAGKVSRLVYERAVKARAGMGCGRKRWGRCRRARYLARHVSLRVRLSPV